MFDFSSARTRALLAGLVLVVVLSGVTVLVTWRTEGHQRHLDELEQTSVMATTLEHARAQFYRQTSALSALVLTQDPRFAEVAEESGAALDEDLARVGAGILAREQADDLTILNDLTERRARFDETLRLAVPVLLNMDATTSAQMASGYVGEMWADIDAIAVDLDQLAQNQREQLVADTAAAGHAADDTLWLVVVFVSVSFLVAAGAAGILMLSVTRPLALLRLSARAIAAGNLKARAKVFGPEEVASLARDFNQMTDALAAKTKEYITTTNLTGDIIAKIDAQGRWTFLNDAACAFFGKPRERLLGTAAMAVVRPEDAERTVQTVEAARATKEPIGGFVNRMITHAGTRVVEWNAHPLFDERGEYAGVQMTGRDITERKEAEEALRQAEQRYRALFEDAPAMYVLCRNQDGVPFIADCNELFVTTLGYGRDEVVGRPVADFYTPESRAELLEGGGFQRALVGQFVAEERQLVTKDGRIVETTLRAVPEIGPDGRVLGTRAMYVDITDRKRAEEALRESEERFRQVAESSRGWIWEVNSEGRYTYSSPVVKDVLGYEPEEVIGKRYYDFFTPEDRQQLLPAAEAAFARKEAFFRLVNRNVHKEGHVVVLETTAVPMLDAEGNLLGYRGVDQDITERKQAEEALEESEARYRLLAENTTDLIWTMDLSLRYTYMSPAITRMRGYSVEEIVGNTVRETMTPASLEVAWNALAEELAAERTGQADPFRSRKLELEMYCKDGSTIWTEMNMTFLRDSEGRPTGILGVTRDISERKRVEEALLESEEKYRDLVENLNEVVYALDAEGVITYVSPVVEQLGGYTPSEVIGRSFAEFIHPDDLLPLMQSFQRTVSGNPEPFEYRILSKSGEAHWVRTFSRLVLEGERIVGVRAVLMDITDRKQIEEALRESEARYRLFAENTSDVIWTMDLSLRYTYVSPAITRIRGYSVEEIVGTTVQESMTPASLELVTKVLAEELTMEEMEQMDPRRSWKLKLEVYCKDGSTIWTEMNMTFLRDSEGRPTGILGVTRDISERKQMEQALSARMEEYVATANLTGDIIAKIDHEGKWTFLNDAACQFLGKPRKRLLGKDARVSVHPEDLEPTIQAILEAREKKQPIREFVNRQITPTGTRVVEWNAYPLFDEQGEYAGIQMTGRDITERKRMEDALRESEARYRLLAENATDIIWTTDMNLRFTYQSPSVARIRGYSPEEAMAQTIEETLAPASLEVARKILAEELAPEKMDTKDLSRSRTLELEHTCKDGSTVWLEVTTAFLRDEDGRPVGLLGASRDISERKRAEEALRTKDSAIASSINAIALADLDGDLTYVNPSTIKMWGYDDEKELLGRPIHRFWQAREKALEVGKALREKGSWAGELVAIRRDGSTFDVEMLASMVTDEAGKHICMMGSFLDVTERKRMEDALREGEARYRLLAENTSDLIWTMDLSLRYTYISPAITRMRGYSVEEIVGTTVQETMTPASLEVARKILAEELAIERTGEADPFRSRKLELEMYCKDGSTIWTEMNMTFLRDSEGRPTGILGVTRDITERKRAEEERERLHAELETRAVTDSLTGLYNHAYFYQRLAHEIERAGRYGHRFALVMMDVDAFKHYNDSRGHQAGDEALRLVGECIRSAMRRSDLAFRYGGDEFVAILLNTDVPRAQAVVRRINRRIAARLKEMGDSAGGWLGVSAGVACFPEDATTVDELVRVADGAMYDAKRLAWARGVMGRGGAVESVAWPIETPHETQTRMLSGAASSLAAALEDLTGPQVLSETDLRTLAALGAAAEIKDPYIRGHQERTSRLAATVAKEMGLEPDRVRNVTTAGLLHDLGKVSVGESILNKQGKLSESEFARMKEHASLGATMIVSGAEALQPLAPIVRHHHEQVDGNGYPDGLARENIPLEARILSVADAFDAMTHERAYRKALSTEEALGEIQRGAGTRFDRAVVEAFLGVVRRRGGELG